MKSLLLMVALVSILMLTAGAVPVKADDKGYGFVFAYSHRLKVAYHSPLFTHPAEGQALSENEYHADIKMIRKMEDALAKHLQTKLQVNPGMFDFSSRTGYKTETLALRQLEVVKADLRTQGLEMKILPDFTVKP